MEQNYLAVFSSLNQVNLVKRECLQNGVFIEMVRSPQCLSHRGCSFALRCTDKQLNLIAHVSGKAQIAFAGLYLETIRDGERQYTPVPSGGELKR